jgi:hypothetical protein
VIIAIGDLAQNIYRFRGTSNEFLRERLQADIEPSLQSFTLTTNFRSSKSILRLANALFEPEIKAGGILPMHPSEKMFDGPIPQYFEFAVNPSKGLGEYEERVVNTLVPIILNAKKEKKSIVLIFPIMKCSAFQLISSLLRQKSKHCGYGFDIHQIAKEDETCTTVAFQYDPKDADAPVQCSTFHSSKGLEWDIVALINVDDSMYNVRQYEEECEAHDTEKTNLFYVGVTRAIETLLIFGNANHGGRHRHLARLGDRLTQFVKFTQWGTEVKESGRRPPRPIGVTDLVRRFPQHPEILKRAIACSEHIKVRSQDGCRILREDVYNVMKQRNREMAFGTYIDWKMKNLLCKGEAKTSQAYMLELLGHIRKGNWISKDEATDSIDLRMARLDVFFLNAGVESKMSLESYIVVSRYMALYKARCFGFVDTYRDLYYEIENIIKGAMKKEVRTIQEEYILALSRDFFTRGSMSDIQAVSAPRNSYMGLPEEFEEFVATNSSIMTMAIYECLAEIDAMGTNMEGDVPLQSESLILGEADMISNECGGILIEMKCGTAKKAEELRDTGNCKHLLQVLAYVALARHGVIQTDLRWACIVNPLTGAWEIYDLESWSREQSWEFMECLEILRNLV